MIIDHSFAAEHVEAVGRLCALVVEAWRHATLKPGEVVEITGGHRGSFVREITRQEYEMRVREAGALEWLAAGASDAHFWEVAWD